MDYLDITFDLNTGTYKPYNKINNDPRYINASSNHPPNIIKHISKFVSKRISTNSSNEDIFNMAAPYYNKILEKCGYKEKINYCNTNENNNRKSNRGRKIIWYNPPYSINVKTNIANQFLKLIRKHFNKSHPYNKIFNKNSVKVSYSCMNNMKTIINNHNNKILQEETLNARLCNCKNKNQCPLEGRCLTKDIVYAANVTTTSDQKTKTYIGISETEFKTRYRNHQKSLNHRRYEKDTELSKFVWALRDQDINFEIKWSILRRSPSYNPISKSCSLCLTEKLLLCNYKDKENLINSRIDLVSKCRHKNKFIIGNN